MMDYRQLADSIKKGERFGVYLLHGQEEYVKERMLERLQTLLAPQVMQELNVNVLRAATDEAIIGACMTPPMMAERKLVVVRDCPLLGTDNSEGQKQSSDALRKGTDHLTAYLDHTPENVHVVFFQRGKVSGNNRLKKYLSAHAKEVLIDSLNQVQARSWILARARQEGFSMDAEAADILFYYVGPAMGEVASELEKLVLYARGRNHIGAGDVQAVTQDRSSVKVFALTDALAMGQIQKAYEMLEGVRRGDVEPFQILYMIARQYRLIVRYCLLHAGGITDAAIEKELGLQNFVYRGLKRQASVTGQARAQEVLAILLDAEDGLKTGRYRDEAFIVDAALARVAALYQRH